MRICGEPSGLLRLRVIEQDRRLLLRCSEGTLSQTLLAGGERFANTLPAPAGRSWKLVAFPNTFHGKRVFPSRHSSVSSPIVLVEILTFRGSHPVCVSSFASVS